jgi:peptidoglycan/xylan/chitin deacetylase (PgdA/CDA1 family)
VKTYRKLFRGGIYAVILIGVISAFSFSKIKEDNSNQAISTVEVVQGVGGTTQYTEEQLKEHRQAVEQKRLAEKKRLEALANKSIGSTKGVTILMYHIVSDGFENYMSVPKNKFREQMKYLKDNGYNIINLDDLHSYYVADTPIPDKSIIITFDDGTKDQYTNAYPILKEFGFKATIFAYISDINKKDFITDEQIKELDKNGISIECHSVTHPELSKLSYEKQFVELEKSKMYLEKVLGREIKYFAYPYGDFNDDTVLALHNLQYKMALNTVVGKAQKSNGVYMQRRNAVYGRYNIEDFKKIIK